MTVVDVPNLQELRLEVLTTAKTLKTTELLMQRMTSQVSLNFLNFPSVVTIPEDKMEKYREEEMIE